MLLRMFFFPVVHRGQIFALGGSGQVIFSLCFGGGRGCRRYQMVGELGLHHGRGCSRRVAGLRQVAQILGLWVYHQLVQILGVGALKGGGGRGGRTAGAAGGVAGAKPAACIVPPSSPKWISSLGCCCCWQLSKVLMMLLLLLLLLLLL